MSYKSMPGASPTYLVAPRSDKRCSPVNMLLCDLQTGVVTIATFGGLVGLLSIWGYSDSVWGLSRAPQTRATSIGTVIVQLALAILQIFFAVIGILGATRCKVSYVKTYFIWSIVFLVLSVGADCSSMYGTFERCDARYDDRICDGLPMALNEYIPLILHAIVWIYFVIVIAAFKRQLLDSVEGDHERTPIKHRHPRPMNGTNAVHNVV